MLGATVVDEMGNVVFSDDSVATVSSTTRATAPGITDLQYYKNKVAEFQAVLYAIDEAAGAAQRVADFNANSPLADDMLAKLAEYDAKKTQLRLTAEGMNLAIAGVDFLGADIQKLVIPPGLGLAPAALAGIAAAVAAAAVLIVWGRDWIAGVNERLKLAMQFEQMSPEVRSATASELAKVDAAAAAASTSTFAQLSGIIKWVAIAGVAYFAFKAFSQMRKA